MNLSRVLPIAAMLGVCAVTAHADTYHFSFSGPNVDSVSFNLPSSPTPIESEDGAFVLNANVEVTLVGSSTPKLNTDALVFFYVDGPNDAYINVTDDADDPNGPGELSYSVPVVFTGSYANPTFVTGSFSMYEDPNLLTNPQNAFPDGTLTITDLTPPPAPAPEPSSLALLGTGVLGFAGVLKRRMSRIS